MRITRAPSYYRCVVHFSALRENVERGDGFDSFKSYGFDAAVTVVNARSKDSTPRLTGFGAPRTERRSDITNKLRGAFIQAATLEFCEFFGVSSLEELTLHVQACDRRAMWNTAYLDGVVFAQLPALAAELVLAEDAAFMVEFDLSGKVIRRVDGKNFHQGCLDMLKRHAWIRTLVVDVSSAGPVRELAEDPNSVQAAGRIVEVVALEERDDLKAQAENEPLFGGRLAPQNTGGNQLRFPLLLPKKSNAAPINVDYVIEDELGEGEALFRFIVPDLGAAAAGDDEDVKYHYSYHRLSPPPLSPPQGHAPFPEGSTLQRASDLLQGTFGKGLGGKKVRDVTKALGEMCVELVEQLDLDEDELKIGAGNFNLAFQSVRRALPNVLPLATVYSRVDQFRENVFQEATLQASAAAVRRSWWRRRRLTCFCAWSTSRARPPFGGILDGQW